MPSLKTSFQLLNVGCNFIFLQLTLQVQKQNHATNSKGVKNKNKTSVPPGSLTGPTLVIGSHASRALLYALQPTLDGGAAGQSSRDWEKPQNKSRRPVLVLCILTQPVYWRLRVCIAGEYIGKRYAKRAGETLQLRVETAKVIRERRHQSPAGWVAWTFESTAEKSWPGTRRAPSASRPRAASSSPQAAAGETRPPSPPVRSAVGGGATSPRFPELDQPWHMEGAARALPVPAGPAAHRCQPASRRRRGQVAGCFCAPLPGPGLPYVSSPAAGLPCLPPCSLLARLPLCV